MVNCWKSQYGNIVYGEPVTGKTLMSALCTYICIYWRKKQYTYYICHIENNEPYG